MTRSLFKFVAPLLFIACFAPGGSAQGAGPEVIVDRFVQAWNSHDPDAWGRLFADDAVWVTVAESRAEGRGNIVKDFAEAHATWAKATSLVQRDVEVRRLGPDVAVVLFRAGFLDGQGRLIPHSERALMVAVVKKQAGWRIAAGQLEHPTPEPK